MIAPSVRPEHGSQLPPASYDRMRFTKPENTEEDAPAYCKDKIV